MIALNGVSKVKLFGRKTFENMIKYFIQSSGIKKQLYSAPRGICPRLSSLAAPPWLIQILNFILDKPDN